MKLETQGCCEDAECTPDTCMILPEGRVCGDCIYFTECNSIRGCELDDRICEWFPRRFKYAGTQVKGV